MKCRYCDLDILGDGSKEWRENVIYWHEKGHEWEIKKQNELLHPPPPPVRYAAPLVPAPQSLINYDDLRARNAELESQLRRLTTVQEPPRIVESEKDKKRRELMSQLAQLDGAS